MTKFKNIVVEYTEDAGQIRVAGMNGEWNREMIISDCGMPEELKGKKATFLYPYSAVEREWHLLKKQAQNYQITPVGYVNTVAGIAEFYRKQKAVSGTDRDLITVNVNKKFAEIGYLKNTSKFYEIRETQRMDFCMETDKEVLRQVLAEIKKLLYRHRISKAVILLAGKIWLKQEIVELVKDRFKDCTIASYRPDVAALLGSVLYMRNHTIISTSCSFPEGYELYHYRGFWGEVSKLNDYQKEGYWKILEAVMNGQKEVRIKGTMKDMEYIYAALSIDYPEIRIIWKYVKSVCYLEKIHKTDFIKIVIEYNSSGRSLLSRISSKAGEILRECTERNNTWSDREIIKKLYVYMAENYCYTKEKNSDGSFPEYTYTLETLLRNGVCHGFATSFIYLARRIQIGIGYVGGKADGAVFGGHAWNMVQTVNGDYRHMDITWDLGRGRSENEMKYYIVDDIGMRARRHFWKVQDYPRCV